MNVKNQDLLCEIIYNLLYSVEALNFSKRESEKNLKFNITSQKTISEASR